MFVITLVVGGASGALIGLSVVKRLRAQGEPARLGRPSWGYLMSGWVLVASVFSMVYGHLSDPRCKQVAARPALAERCERYHSAEVLGVCTSVVGAFGLCWHCASTSAAPTHVPNTLEKKAPEANASLPHA